MFGVILVLEYQQIFNLIYWNASMKSSAQGNQRPLYLVGIYIIWLFLFIYIGFLMPSNISIVIWRFPCLKLRCRCLITNYFCYRFLFNEAGSRKLVSWLHFFSNMYKLKLNKNIHRKLNQLQTKKGKITFLLFYLLFIRDTKINILSTNYY